MERQLLMCLKDSVRAALCVSVWVLQNRMVGADGVQHPSPCDQVAEARSPLKPRGSLSHGLVPTKQPHVLLLVKPVGVQHPSKPVLKVYWAEDSG